MILSLKAMAVLSLSSILLGAMVVFGLKTTTLMEEGNGGVVVEATKFPLKLTMVFNKTTFEAGKIVNFTLILENIGNETLTIYWGPVDHFSYAIYDKSGSKVYEPDSAWLAIYMPPSHLPRALACVAVIPWHQPYDFLPGTYQIVGLFISHKLSLNLTIETSPVTVTLT